MQEQFAKVVDHMANKNSIAKVFGLNAFYLTNFLMNSFLIYRLNKKQQFHNCHCFFHLFFSGYKSDKGTITKTSKSFCNKSKFKFLVGVQTLTIKSIQKFTFYNSCNYLWP